MQIELTLGSLLVAFIGLTFCIIIYLFEYVDVGGFISSSSILIFTSILENGMLFSTYIIIGFTFIIIVTKIKHDTKKRLSYKIGKIYKKRSASNIFAKLIVPLFGLVIGNPGVFLATISFGVADSFSSEVGMLSKKAPRLITNIRKKINHGVDGGITYLGTTAAILISILMGVIAWALFNYELEIALFFSLGFGLFGTIIDSLLGATLQKRGKLNNQEVNLSTAIVCGLFGFIFWYLILGL